MSHRAYRDCIKPLSNATKSVAITLVESVAILTLVDKLVSIVRPVAVIGLTKVFQLLRRAVAMMIEIVRSGSQAVAIAHIEGDVRRAEATFYVHVIVAIGAAPDAVRFV